MAYLPEDWLPDEPVSPVLAATAWHRVDPRIGYPQAWQRFAGVSPGGRTGRYDGTGERYCM